MSLKDEISPGKMKGVYEMKNLGFFLSFVCDLLVFLGFFRREID